MFVAPNGKVFHAGCEPITRARYLDTNGNGLWWGTYTEAASQANPYLGWRLYGSPVMYDRGKLLLIGGGNDDGTAATDKAVTNTVQMVDLLPERPVFRMAASMEYPRIHANATVLPDGTVLVSGGARVDFPGAEYGVLPAEIWTPPTAATPGGSWRTVASLSVPRMYHSAAVLLPDGRVLTAGGGDAQGHPNYPSAQVYTPHYLTHGYQPPVAYAPTNIGYNQPFQLESPLAGHVEMVTLVRLSSTTHSLNMNQRLQKLSFTYSGGPGILTITPPATANDAPPGHYLLYIVDGDGVPSVGKIVQLTAPTCTPQLSLATSSVNSGGCASQVTATATGTNIGTAFRWFINGSYAPAYDDSSQLTMSLSTSMTEANIRVEVSSSCGGRAVGATSTVYANMPWHCFP